MSKKNKAETLSAEDEVKNNIEIAMAEIGAIHKNKKLFIEPNYDDPSVPRVELSLPSLNKILSNKYYGPRAGFAMGKIYNFWGEESIGKTALALQICGEIIKQRRPVLWIDKEGSFDADYALEVYGLDLNDPLFVVERPSNAEEVFDTIKSFLRNNALQNGVYVVDSVTAMSAEKQVDDNADKNSMAVMARKLSDHFSQVVSYLPQNNTSGIYINQIRFTSKGPFWVPDYTGGKSMHFYPHIALKFKKEKEITAGDEFLGLEISILGDKNKTSKPKIKRDFVLYPGHGFSREADIINLGIQTGDIENKGSWFAIGKNEEDELYLKMQGVDKLRFYLQENQDFTNKLWDRIGPNLEPNVDMSTGEILEETTEA